MKVVLFGILLICLNTISGSSFDAITKFLSSSNYKWYHYYSIGNIFSLIVFLFYLNFVGGIKKHIILKNKRNYFIPLARGITFIPIPIIVFFSLKEIPISIFTTVLMTTPFYIFIFSRIIQNEKIITKDWITLFIGFTGVILVLKPFLSVFNFFLLLVVIVAVYNALTNIIVSKYSKKASAYGFTFYNILPLTIFSAFFLIVDPIIPSRNELLLIFSAGLFMFLAILFWTVAFHIAGKYSRIISPFLFTQILWASLFGNIFFSESLDTLSIFGISLIILSGTILLYKTYTKNIS